MSLLMRVKQQRMHLVSLLFLLSSCVTIKDAEVCAIAGTLSAGAICAHTISTETENKTFDQFLDFLEASPEKPDPSNTGKTIPAKAAAVCVSAIDFENLKTELESACRMLKNRCSFELIQAIENLKGNQ